ncbi:MAG: FlgD immunoglobulin-like domain containing protein [bacterium]
MSTLCFGLAADAQASYQFDFVTLDYAVEVSNYGIAYFKTVCTNTGTQGDSIRFTIVQNTPPFWFADYCLEGKCYFGNASVWFDPGETDTIDIEIFVDDVNDMGLVTLTATMKSAPAQTHNATYGAWNQVPSILIVDDDAGQAYQTYLVNALDSLGYPGRVWNANTQGRPSSLMLNSHWMVFWTTAGGDCSYFTTADEANLASFLAADGKLFLASAGFLSSRGAGSTFMTDYLHLASWTGDTGGNPIVGVAGDPISDGMSLDISGGPVPLAASDSFTLNAPAEVCFEATSGLKGLWADEDNHKVVFLSFPFENVSTAAPDPNNQEALILSIMDWFEPPVAGVPREKAGDGLVLRSVTSNPFAGSATMAFAVAGGSARAELAIYDVAGRAVRVLHRGRVGSAESAVVWDGRDGAGCRVAPGVYFVKLSAEGSAAMTKLVLAK